MQKDDLIFVHHILERIQNILSYTKGLDEDSFVKNQLIQDAVIRNFEVIGEATKNLSSTFRKRYLQIPWTEMAGMRDKLIHFYIGVDLQIVWSTVVELSAIKDEIETIIHNESSTL